jgi:hypothetical protein
MKRITKKIFSNDGGFKGWRGYILGITSKKRQEPYNILMNREPLSQAAGHGVTPGIKPGQKVEADPGEALGRRKNLLGKGVIPG